MTPSSPAPQQQSNKLPLVDDETKALLQLGFIVPIDFVFAAVLFLGAFATIVWIAAAKPDFVYVMAVAICMLILLSVWTLTVAYRGIYFTLKMRAVMETMPEEAAKIAFKIHEIKMAQPGQPQKIAPMPPGL